MPARDQNQRSRLKARDLCVEEQGIKVLKVAGPRLSGWPEGHAFTAAAMGEVIVNAISNPPS